MPRTRTGGASKDGARCGARTSGRRSAGGGAGGGGNSIAGNGRGIGRRRRNLTAYGQSPRSLIPRQVSQFVSLNDPPFEITGMINIILDTRGDLISFVAMPPQKILAEAWTQARPPVDWTPWFEEAGLDLKRFKPE